MSFHSAVAASAAPPILVDIGAARFDSVAARQDAPSRPFVEQPPPTTHTIVLRSDTAYDVEFKIRSSSPTVIFCTPSSGTLHRFQQVAVNVEIQLFRLYPDGLFRAVDGQQENPRLKISAVRIRTQGSSEPGKLISDDHNFVPYEMLLAPFAAEPLVAVPQPTASAARSGDRRESTVQRRVLSSPRKSRELESREMEVEPFLGHTDDVYDLIPVVSSKASSSCGGKPQTQQQHDTPASPPPLRATGGANYHASPDAMASFYRRSQKQKAHVAPTVQPQSPQPFVQWADDSQRVHVVVRCRPRSSSSQDHQSEHPPVSHLHHARAGDWHTTETSMGDADQVYFFDGVMSGEENNHQVSAVCGIPGLMKDVANGYNACVLLYGQTNSGKTHTLFGSFVPSLDADQGRRYYLGNHLDEDSSGRRASSHVRSQHQTEQGILFHALHQLFQHIHPNRGDVCSLSLFEVYNEEVRDLFADTTMMGGPDGDAPPAGGRRVHVVFDPLSDAFQLTGLSETRFSDLGAGLALLSVGLSRVTVGASHLNDRSSRAHTICRVRVVRQQVVGDGDDHHDSKRTSFISDVHFVDLAGSESLSHTSAQVSPETMSDILASAAAAASSGSWNEDFVRNKSQHHISRGISKRETASINLSLTSLKKCILALSKGQQRQSDSRETLARTQSVLSSRRDSVAFRKSSAAGMMFVPYRDSTLTKILKSTLAGNSRVLMVCTVSTDHEHHRETKATLAFGTLAKSVSTAATQNVVVQEVQRSQDIKRLESDNASLRERIIHLETMLLSQSQEVSRGTVSAMLPGAVVSTRTSIANSLPAAGRFAPSVDSAGGMARVDPLIGGAHLDAMFNAYEASESRLSTLITDTLRYLTDGTRSMVLFDQSSALIGLHSRRLASVNAVVRRGYHHSAPPSAATTPRYHRQISGHQSNTVSNVAGGPSNVKELTIRLKLPQGRQGAELIVVDGNKHQRIKLDDVSRVVLGKNYPELRLVSSQRQRSDGSSSNEPLLSVTIYPLLSSSGGSFSTSRSGSTYPGGASKEPLLTFLCFDDRDVEAWVIALAHLSVGGGSLVSSSTLFEPNRRFMEDPKKPARGPVVPRASSFMRRAVVPISWDINAMTRKFPYAPTSRTGPPSSRLQRTMSPSFGPFMDEGVSDVLPHLHEREILLCKQHNISVADFYETKTFLVGGGANGASLISLYDVRCSCPVNLFQAFVIVRLLKEMQCVKDLHILVRSRERSDWAWSE